MKKYLNRKDYILLYELEINIKKSKLRRKDKKVALKWLTKHRPYYIVKRQIGKIC